MFLNLTLALTLTLNSADWVQKRANNDCSEHDERTAEDKLNEESIQWGGIHIVSYWNTIISSTIHEAGRYLRNTARIYM